ncbi:RadC family protein [Varunaivibrio sulfuroxidans]|uniref:DNA repair protein RadC n=1 Tax=Varunaivibrio sulfuroxidans TaxID=1773489 RepID=A0A4R3JHU1_9PROT|nr:DNA repair protein RadC [Varunaivibrio sulfuroxidans]TCS65085.1 DNA repair protein RadC [Varunaivibrio sulfuroxidans]WES29628.1 DNA repair protein RadC [Varunaivibrio sulfuroxidans]
MRPPSPHNGHRQRLRARFLKGGSGALADYEMLELVLFMALPRQDVKPLAKALIKRFGSYAGAISADRAELMALDGVGDSVVTTLKVVRESALLLGRESLLGRPVLANWQSLIDYCRAAMGFEKTEQFRILFLNRKNALIADEMQQTGTVDHTPVYPREVIKRALELGASAIIMVHNHPSDEARPSKDDIAMTKNVRDAGEKLGIVLHDHIIVTKAAHSSFKAMGLL